jgi:hypothetical protein
MRALFTDECDRIDNEVWLRGLEEEIHPCQEHISSQPLPYPLKVGV